MDVPWDRLAVMLWANAAVGISGLPAIKFYDVFPSTRREGGQLTQSQAFARCLTEGRPFPLLLLADGSKGPAMKVEEEVPGTLKWLIHPLYRVLGESLWRGRVGIRQAMLLTEDDVFRLLFRQWGRTIRRRTDLDTQSVVDALRAIGTLDALATMLYLAIEARGKGNRLATQIIDREARRNFDDWACLSWMRPENKRRLRLAMIPMMRPLKGLRWSREVQRKDFAVTVIERVLPRGIGFDTMARAEAIDLVLECMEGKGALAQTPVSLRRAAARKQRPKDRRRTPRSTGLDLAREWAESHGHTLQRGYARVRFR